MTGTRFSLARLVVVVALLSGLTAACGSGDKKVATSPDTTLAVGGVPTTPAATDTPKAAARWETVTNLTGAAGTSSHTFDVPPGAIQWRARYDCAGGSIKLETTPPPRRGGALLDTTTCPKSDQVFSIVTGSVKLTVTATGTWKVAIDQQVDTPLNEPPLAAMATARVLSQGPFYNVEKNGEGTARVYRLPDGTNALRIENLKVNENTDLFVWLDAAKSPKTSKDVASAQNWVLGNLKSTVGSQNYTIPADIPIDQVNSVVIWCQPVQIAYAAVALA